MRFFQSLAFDFVDMLNFEERPFRAKFVPAKIWNDLDQYRNDPDGLKNYFKKWKCKIVFHKPKKEGKMIPVGGWYYPEDIRSELEIWTGNFKKFEFTERSWDRFKYKLLQTLMHELIHCRQYMGKHEEFESSKVRFHRTGVKRIDDNRHYHSGRDEIEAYAHCIFLEYKCFRPTIPISTLIRRARTKRDSTTFSGIIKVFGNDPRNNSALPLLARKILTWERKYNRCLGTK